jgi:hypothetical protein
VGAATDGDAGGGRSAGKLQEFAPRWFLGLVYA